MRKKKTTAEFIKDAREVHGSQYDYSATKYQGVDKRIKIICLEKDHGLFEQIARNHLAGSGCPECGYMKIANKLSNNIEGFLLQAKEQHGNKYGYSLVEYQNNYTEIKIHCPIEGHGLFEQLPYVHIKGSGCPTCSNLNQIDTLDNFIQKARIKHGDKYIYSEVIYKGTKKEVTIICQEHGKFEQIAGVHTGGHGCPICGRINIINSKTDDLNSFLKKAIAKHGARYSYSSVIDYNGCREKIKIICLIHGEFEQIPYTHLSGSGCPSCSLHISKPEQQWLSYLDIPDIAQYRQVPIKIDNYRIKKVDGFNPITNTIYEFYGDYYHGNPNKYQSQDLNKVVHKTFGQLYQKTIDRENLLKSAGYNLITIWESEWKAVIKIIKTLSKCLVKLAK